MPTKCLLIALLTSLFVAVSTALASAQAPEIRTGLSGRWVINDELSDNTDDQVEKAIEAGGGKGSRGFFNRQEDFYRGGPPEHELYDRISFDDVLSIEVNEPELRFTYDENFQRVFHSDGRRRRASATGFYSEGGTDFSSGLFEDNSLVVEGRPRDGGFTIEIYSLESDGNRLRIEMTIQPDSFREPIELVRYFDRAE
ncbi:MAG TPA: hypothetical protein DEF79_08585 [Gammaproteobacteria bacterium]|nr:hypothetical protein [Gammaproteobacteria bacterium]|tara:strand:- start:3235 stop:3828 length:594 start_codon:yes stop_codon:yes gene_type:complete